MHQNSYTTYKEISLETFLESDNTDIAIDKRYLELKAVVFSQATLLIQWKNEAFASVRIYVDKK